MTKLNVATILFMLLHISTTYAQAVKKEHFKKKLFFTSYIGKAYATNSIKRSINNGFLAMTGLEVMLKPKSYFFGEVNFDGYKYRKEYTNLTIANSFNAIAFTTGYKFSFTQKRIAPFIKLGIGFASIKFPAVYVKNGVTDIKDVSKIVFHYMLSSGVAYQLNKSNGIFSDIGLQKYNSSGFLDQNISLISIRVGVRSAF